MNEKGFSVAPASRAKSYFCKSVNFMLRGGLRMCIVYNCAPCHI